MTVDAGPRIDREVGESFGIDEEAGEDEDGRKQANPSGQIR